ncbi:hypothetical protein FHG87_004556 [Trinorchestia longiramus]|nr:hypothetical protein FHG87_004556 [Trinorchestia longiramus]
MKRRPDRDAKDRSTERASERVHVRGDRREREQVRGRDQERERERERGRERERARGREGAEGEFPRAAER